MAKDVRGYVRRRGDNLEVVIALADGRRLTRGTGLSVGQEAEAEAVLEVALEELRYPAAPLAPAEPALPGSLREWGEAWIEDRKTRGKLEWVNEKTHLDSFLFPVLGKRPLTAVSDVELIDWVRGLERQTGPSGKSPSPKYVRAITATARALFKEAVRRHMIDRTPCIWEDGDLPEMEANSRVIGAGFELEQVRSLIYSPRIPEDRRVLYALEFLTGMRTGEAAARQWADWEETYRGDLGRLVAASAYSSRHRLLKSTKTRVEKWIPVHPALAAILSDWRESGWERFCGKKPEPTDLMVPAVGGGCRSSSVSWRSFRDDLERLGIPHQRHYETRSTFINLCEGAGALPEDVARLTHASQGQAKDLYRRVPQLWPRLCAAVRCIKLEPPPKAASQSTGGGGCESTGFAEIKASSQGINEKAPDETQNVCQRAAHPPEKPAESLVSGGLGAASRRSVGAGSSGSAAEGEGPATALPPGGSVLRLPDALPAFVEASGTAAARAVELGDLEAARRALRGALQALEAVSASPVLRLVPRSEP